mmetsp:Transcript_2800/g.3985  ORF Transcript_2800/g.3985 Transcript_2800/m.3985 type:complete len:523 (+) Transcript_2800:79-1647(+)
MTDSSLLQSAISADGSVVAVAVPSGSTSTTNRRHLIQIYQVASPSCSLQSTLTHTTDQTTLTQLIMCGSSLLVALFGTVEVVVWDLNRGVVAQKFRTQDDDSSFLALSSCASEQAFYLLTRYGPKLYAQEYKNGKVTRKIKCGKWEDDEVDAMGLAVSEDHIAVKSSAGIRILKLDTAKKAGKIKNKGASGKMVVCQQEATLAVLESAGSVVLYSMSNGKELARISHDMTASSPQQATLQVESRGKSGEYTLLVDSTVYEISGSASEKITQLSTSSGHPAAACLCKGKVLALIYQMGGCRSKWIDMEAGNVPASVSLDKEEEPASTQDGKKGKRKSGESQPMVLGPGQAGVEPSQPVLKKPKIDDDAEEPKDLSIAERLQQLAEAMDEEDDDESSPAPTTSFKPRNATTESLKEFLTQALKSGDESLLELALNVRDVKVMATTVKQIDPDLVRVLLSKLTTKLASNPMRAEHLSKWVKCCLQSGKFKPNQLAPLRNLMYERVESYGDLLRLKGRLSMMCDTE